MPAIPARFDTAMGSADPIDDPASPFDAASADLAGRRREQLLTLYDLDTPDVDTPDELAEIVELARRITGADGSQLNVLGADRQHTLQGTGSPEPEPSVPLSSSVCATVLDRRAGERLVVIPDTTTEPMLHDHPAVVGDSGIGFYAGVPLTSTQGWPIGMLCVWSSAPQQLDDMQSALLRQLGNAAMHILETRRRVRTTLAAEARQGETDVATGPSV